MLSGPVYYFYHFRLQEKVMIGWNTKTIPKKDLLQIILFVIVVGSFILPEIMFGQHYLNKTDYHCRKSMLPRQYIAFVTM